MESEKMEKRRIYKVKRDQQTGRPVPKSQWLGTKPTDDVIIMVKRDQLQFDEYLLNEQLSMNGPEKKIKTSKDLSELFQELSLDAVEGQKGKLSDEEEEKKRIKVETGVGGENEERGKMRSEAVERMLMLKKIDPSKKIHNPFSKDSKTFFFSMMTEGAQNQQKSTRETTIGISRLMAMHSHIGSDILTIDGKEVKINDLREAVRNSRVSSLHSNYSFYQLVEASDSLLEKKETLGLNPEELRGLLKFNVPEKEGYYAEENGSEGSLEKYDDCEDSNSENNPNNSYPPTPESSNDERGESDSEEDDSEEESEESLDSSEDEKTNEMRMKRLGKASKGKGNKMEIEEEFECEPVLVDRKKKKKGKGKMNKYAFDEEEDIDVDF